MEGASISAQLPITGQLDGYANIGEMLQIDATAQANFDASASLTLSDFDSVANERLYLFSTDGMDEFQIDDAVSNPQALDFNGSVSLAAALRVDNPAVQLPFIGDYLPSDFSWNASVVYNLLTGEGTYTIVQDPTFETLVGLFEDAESGLLDFFIDEIDEYNPLHQDVRTLLNTTIPLVGNETL